MKDQSDINFISLLQDEEFLDLARNFDVSDNQIREFIALHPEKEEEVKLAVTFLKSNLSDQKKLASGDFLSVWQNIRLSLSHSPKSSLVRRLWTSWSKIAAMLAVVLTGVTVAYYFYQADAFRRMAHTDIEVGQDAVIVLSDGTLHRLKENDAYVEYSADGMEVLVKDNVSEQEKLENARNKKSESLINQIIVPYGRRHLITLSDGTRVHLNSGSTLIYPAGFNKKTRTVYLKGEGYFEVAANLKQPFIVKTDFMDLKVLGTSFNISAYKDEETVSAILVEGKVTVRHRNELLGYTKNDLVPGQGLFYSVESSGFQVRNVDILDFISWKDGILRFKDQSLLHVVNRVEKYYNREIDIQNANLEKIIISGKLVLSDDFETVMELLSKTVEVHYERKDNQTYLLTE